MSSWLRTFALIGVMACGGGTPGPSGPQPDGVQVGGEGAICGAGSRHPPDAAPAVYTCAEGLECCYPCGIEGCDSVCMADCGPPRP